VRLHDHPRSSNAQKVRFLLGVFGLECESRTVPFEGRRPDWHLAVSPLGGIPALILRAAIESVATRLAAFAAGSGVPA
jgi:glutathione S-transferase